MSASITGSAPTLDRRQLLKLGTLAAASTFAPLSLLADEASRRLPVRKFPHGDEALPVIGLGNSNAFRQGDMETSSRVISTLLDYGGAYVDCSGDSRFVVAKVAAKLGASPHLFLGTYFSGADDASSRREAKQLLQIVDKRALDLMHNYPEDAVPNWDRFRAWKDDGLTRHIGVARHRKEAYDAMMKLMQTGTVDVLQVNYSPMEPEAADRILPMAMDLGVVVTINRPFINGQWFSIVKGRPLPEWTQEFDCESWAQFSLKFIISHPAVHCVLTETANPKHAVDNLGAGFGRLPDEKMRKRMLAYVQDLV